MQTHFLCPPLSLVPDSVHKPHTHTPFLTFLAEEKGGGGAEYNPYRIRRLQVIYM